MEEDAEDLIKHWMHVIDMVEQATREIEAVELWIYRQSLLNILRRHIRDMQKKEEYVSVDQDLFMGIDWAVEPLYLSKENTVMSKDQVKQAVEVVEPRNGKENKVQLDVKKATKMLQQALAAAYESTEAVKREGDRIIIPENMTFRDAAQAILDHEKRMNETIKTLVEISCYPSDGLVAFYSACKRTFGGLIGTLSFNFWGDTIPGKSLNVHISYEETVNVPVGVSQIPGLPITMDIRPNYDSNLEMGGQLVVIFEYPRKYEPLVKKIEQLTRQELKEHSIFSGQAINSKFEFINLSGFDPERVVYAKQELAELTANVFSPISDTAAWRRNNCPLKRGILLYGNFGVGKTLTALYTAVLALRSGWTFINVLPEDDIVAMLKFARHYEPAVVFVEDIDKETAGSERTSRINAILDATDGLLSKNSEVMVVMTSNRVEQINQGMLRPGRLDSIIQLGRLDPETVIRLIHIASQDMSGQSLILGDLNTEQIFHAAEGYVPAFVSEAVTKAKAYAIARGSSPLTIDTEDICLALEELRPQWDMMNLPPQEDPPTKIIRDFAGLWRKAYREAQRLQRTSNEEESEE